MKWVLAYCPKPDCDYATTEEKPDRCPLCGEWTTLAYE